MKETCEDTVDDGFKEREMPMEREYQRVAITGEEKCGVRAFYLTINHHLDEINSTVVAMS